MRLDYISCFLTIGSTVLIGKRQWQGWLIAAANSVIICYIGLQTEQTGFIPANIFCLGIYGYNVYQWRVAKPGRSQSAAKPDIPVRLTPRHRSARNSGARRRQNPASRVRPIRNRFGEAEKNGSKAPSR
jgi:hypothetical protein